MKGTVGVVTYVLLGVLWLGVAYYDLIAGYLLVDRAYAGVATQDEIDAITAFSNALLPISFCVFIAAALIFVSLIWHGADFLREHGHLEMPEFSRTVLFFIVPFVNFYFPWRNMAVVRNSLAEYVNMGRFQVMLSGKGLTIWLAVLYFAAGLAVRAAGIVISPTPDSVDAYKASIRITGLLYGLWALSFAYSIYYLLSFRGLLAAAQTRFAGRSPHRSDNDLSEFVTEPVASAPALPQSAVRNEGMRSEALKVEPPEQASSKRVDSVPLKYAEGFRRTAVAIAVSWFGMTLLVAWPNLTTSPHEYNRTPMADALSGIGFSAIAYFVFYISLKGIAWIVRGFQRKPSTAIWRYGSIAAAVVGFIGVVLLLASSSVRASEDARFVSSFNRQGVSIPAPRNESIISPSASRGHQSDGNPTANATPSNEVPATSEPASDEWPSQLY